jgi:hypothetical protein
VRDSHITKDRDDRNGKSIPHISSLDTITQMSYMALPASPQVDDSYSSAGTRRRIFVLTVHDDNSPMFDSFMEPNPHTTPRPAIPSDSH